MEINSIGRHLLSMGSFSSSQVGANFPVFSLVCGVAASFIVVMALVLCVCGEKPKTEVNKKDGKIEMRDKKERKADRKSLKSQTSIKNGVAVEAKDVTIDMEQPNRHSDSSVSNGGANGRPLSHDQRALPEIPNHPRGAAVSDLQTDEDEEEPGGEGHYDIIHGSKKQADTQQKKAPTGGAKAGNQYEEVNLDANNPDYDGIKDDVTSDPGYAGIPANNPYATVTGIGQAVYARIDEKNKTSNPLQRHNSRDTVNSSVSVPPPPVPDKNFETQEEIQVGGASALIVAHAQVPGPGGSSPSLPPRNGAASGDSPEIIGDAALAMPAPGAMVAVSSNQNDASIPVMSGGGAAGGDMSGAAKAEPPYSKVTARESLQNMRDRGVDLNNLHAFHDPLEEVTYETVNYEQIKSTGGVAEAGAPRRPGDRTSLTSDLYAEIEGGETSTRSSMYATVGEGKSTHDTHAPTPPPVNALRNISHASDDETPDPGYSKIKGPRPKTMGTVADIGASEGTSLPVYAKVDKNRKKRNTTNLDEKMEDVEMAKMYAKVNKPKNTKKTNGYEDIDLISAPNNGARPKIKDNNFNGNSSNGSRPSNQIRKNDHNANRSGGGDPGYSTIDLENNPMYDCIDGKSAESEIDPGYDRIQFSATADNGGLILDSSSRTRTIPGVAMEICEDANANPQLETGGNNQTRPKREHIYQEISEAQKDKEKVVFATSL